MNDCVQEIVKADKTGNCNVVDFNFMSFSGGFGTISIGERFDTGAAMLSRLTAGVPTGEPDGGQIGAFYTGDASANDMVLLTKLIMLAIQ